MAQHPRAAVRAIEDETLSAIISTQRASDQDAADDEMARVRRDENMQSGLPGRGAGSSLVIRRKQTQRHVLIYDHPEKSAPEITRSQPIALLSLCRMGTKPHMTGLQKRLHLQERDTLAEYITYLYSSQSDEILFLNS